MCHRLGEKKGCCTHAEEPGTIDLYYTPVSGACRLVLLVAAALDIKVTHHVLDLSADDQMKPEYLMLNPQHTVPTMVDEGFVLCESRAIAKYLVNKYSEDSDLYPLDPKERALVDARLDFDLGTLKPNFSQYFYPKVLNGGTVPNEVSLKKLQDALKTLDKLLQEHEYAAGSQMTLADLALVSTVSTIDAAEVDLEPYPNILRWYDLVRDNATGYNKYNEKGLRELKRVVKEAEKVQKGKEKAQSIDQNPVKFNEDVNVKPTDTPQTQQSEPLPEKGLSMLQLIKNKTSQHFNIAKNATYGVAKPTNKGGSPDTLSEEDKPVSVKHAKKTSDGVTKPVDKCGCLDTTPEDIKTATQSSTYFHEKDNT